MSFETKTFEILGIFTFVLSLFTAWLSYKIYNYNRLAKGWLAISVAFTLSAVIRLLFFSDNINSFFGLDKIVLKILNSILLIANNVLFIIGFWSMLNSFKSFDVLEKKVKQKVKSLKRGGG